MKLKKNSVLFILFLLFTISAYGQYRKVASNGLDIYYRVTGSGDPVLIIGGGPGDVSDRYLSLSEGLSKNHKAILVDQRGTGKSMPAKLDSTTINVALTLEDFEAIRKDLGLKEWSVIGFSYGGFLASIYTSFYPSSVSSLILIGSLGLTEKGLNHFGDNIRSKLLEPDRQVIEYWSDSTRAADNPKHALVERIRAMMPGYFFDRKKSLQVTQTMKESDFDFDMGEWIWKDVEKRDLDLTKKESDFDKQVLILHGRQDPLGESIPQAVSRYYKKSKLIFIEKAGHYAWMEQPETVFGAIKDFLNVKNK